MASSSHVGMEVVFLIGKKIKYKDNAISFIAGFVMAILIVHRTKLMRLIVGGRETTPILVC